MNTAIYENLNKLGKGSYESMKSLYMMQNKSVEQMIEQQMALMSLGVEFITRQMQLASEAKGYKEMLNGQTEVTMEVSNKIQGIARNTLDIVNEYRDELNTWCENCVKEAEQGIKEAAKVVPVSKAKAA